MRSLRCRNAFRASAAVGLLLLLLSGQTQPLIPAKVCNPTDFWGACATKVKKVIRETNDPAVAVNAAGEWADRYTALYNANARNTWTPTDQARLEEAMTKLWDEAVGKYLDPASLALTLAMGKYFPKMAAVVELAGGAEVTFFMTLIAPSPTANDFSSAAADNSEINKLLMQKLVPIRTMTIRQKYPELFRQGMEKVRGPGVKLIRP